MNVTLRSIVCTLPLVCFGPATALAQPSPVITVHGQAFPTWQAYVRSPLFQSLGLRCKTLPKIDAGPIATLAASDCSYFTSNPTSEYAPTFVYDIPVVFHVITSTSGQGSISNALLQSQIDVLNEDFLAIAGSLGANGYDTKIQFHLATVDPSGNPTNGITTTANNQWFNDGGNYWTPLAWDTHRYLNIYTNQASGYLGYVQDYPQTGIVGTTADRVVALWSSVGRNSPIGPPYNKGRTITHEVAHYLGLYHTFEGGCGSLSNCYGTGDTLCDTNRESTEHYGCSQTNTCSSTDPIHNYLNYTDDICMFEFTPEQARRMRCVLQHWRPLLADTLSNCNSTYGQGCAGSGGITPTLDVQGCASASTQLQITIDHGLGGAQAFLFLGLTPAATPMGGGCTLNVSPILPLIVGPLPLAGIGAGNGAVQFNPILPATTTPGQITLQSFVADASGPLGFSNTPGVLVPIQ